MRIAVTGAAGFIGSNLLPLLFSRGYRVVALTEPGVPTGFNSLEPHPVDVSSGEGLAESLRDADGVIHLAARNHVLKETERDPLSAYRRVNVDGTRNVVRAAVRAGARWFIHFSSVKAMGEGGDAVFDENSPCNPLTPYGISKLESEEVVRHVAGGCDLRAYIFRLPMVYGPRNLGNLPRMIRWADRGLPFPLFQPDNLRSMVYVGNVVHAVLLAIRKAPTGLSTYILKDAEDYSTRRIYDAVCRELGKASRFLPVPAWMVHLGGALSEDIRKVTGSFRVSSEKIRKELGYSPPFSLEQGIAETVQWYKRSAR
jgi:nucleoside-diphosphate-sugar epimerase